MNVFALDLSTDSFSPAIKCFRTVFKQAAKVSRVDRDIPKSSSSHPQVFLKSSDLI